MYCAKCGAWVEEGQNFCASCGAQVQQSTPAPQTQPQQAPTAPTVVVVREPSAEAGGEGVITGILKSITSTFFWILAIIIILGIIGALFSSSPMGCPARCRVNKERCIDECGSGTMGGYCKDVCTVAYQRCKNAC